jgi:hypothetical protein
MFCETCWNIQHWGTINIDSRRKLHHWRRWIQLCKCWRLQIQCCKCRHWQYCKWLYFLNSDSRGILIVFLNWSYLWMDGWMESNTRTKLEISNFQEDKHCILHGEREFKSQLYWTTWVEDLLCKRRQVFCINVLSVL